MVAVATPGFEGLLDHFTALGEFISLKEDEVFKDPNRFRRSRSVTDRYRREVGSELDHVFYHAHSWADTGIEAAYRSGWDGIYSNQPYIIGPKNLQKMAAMREDYRVKLNQMEKYIRRDVDKFFLKTRKMDDVEIIDARVARKMPKIAAGQTRRGRYKLAEWANMQTKSAHQAAFNHGILDAAVSKKIEVMQCTDGPTCGWAWHEDTEKADGKLVSPDEALGHPIAHPNCVRSFIPRPDLNKKDKDDKKKRFSKKQVATAIAATLVGAGVARLLVQVEKEVVDPELYRHYNNIFGRGIFQRTFDRMVKKYQEPGDLIPFYHPPAPDSFPIAAGAEGIEIRAAIARGPVNMSDWGDSALLWGEQILDKRITIPQLPNWAKESLHLLDNDAPTRAAKKIKAYAEWVHSNKVRETAIEQGGNVLNFQLKRREWNDFIILRDLGKFRSAASLTWTKWGPRTRIDMTEFLRGRLTLTKDGIRRSITFNPAGNLRGMLAMSQDGTLMGAARLVPNRLFRAIIETDEFGKITGNVRLVPKNLPFRVRLTFETPRPKNWQYKGLTPGVDFVDLRAGAREARGFGLDDFSMREAFGQLRQMQLKDIHFEVDIFRYGIVDIHGQLKIPVAQVRETVERLMREGLLRRDGEGFTGIFRWVPTDAAKEELQNIIAASEQRIRGFAQFSRLDVGWLARWLPNVRSKAYFDSFRFREVLTSVRISGIQAIRRAPDLEVFQEILQLPEKAWNEFRRASNIVASRIVVFMRDHGLPGSVFIDGFIEERYQELAKNFELTNRSEIFKGTLEAIRGVSQDNVIRLFEDPDTGIIRTTRVKDVSGKVHRFKSGGAAHREWLRILANIKTSDTLYIIERKLQDIVFFIKAKEIESHDVIELLDQIDDQMIHLAARDLARQNERTRATEAARLARLRRKKKG